MKICMQAYISPGSSCITKGLVSLALSFIHQTPVTAQYPLVPCTLALVLHHFVASLVRFFLYVFFLFPVIDLVAHLISIDTKRGRVTWIIWINFSKLTCMPPVLFAVFSLLYCCRNRCIHVAIWNHH